MLIEEEKKIFSIRPITLFVSVVCLLGLSVTATFLIVHDKYQSQLDSKTRELLTVHKNNAALADQNSELQNSLQKLENEFSKLEAQMSAIGAMKSESETAELTDNGFKEMLVLKPKWVNSGETTLAFDGSLRIVLHKASDEDECQKDSTAVGYLSSATGKNKLCLRLGKAEKFTYEGKDYSFRLSGIVTTASVSRYCISISEVFGAGTP